MALANTNQFFDYPMYFVEVELTGVGYVAFLVSSAGGAMVNSGGGGEPYYAAVVSPATAGINETGMGAYKSTAFPPLLSAIKTWAEDADWATLTGADGATYSSITITEYDETATNVTP